MKNLDEWDFLLIQSFKNSTATLEQLRRIWARRCALPFNYCHIRDVNNHLMDLAQDIGLFTRCNLGEFVNELDHTHNWKFLCAGRDYLKKDTVDFDLILLSRLDSLFRLTEVKYLSGYTTFLNPDRS